jgi:hypothetical protein
LVSTCTRNEEVTIANTYVAHQLTNRTIQHRPTYPTTPLSPHRTEPKQTKPRQTNGKKKKYIYIIIIIIIIIIIKRFLKIRVNVPNFYKE